MTGSALTRREKQLLDHLMDGCSNKEIGARLCISTGTVKVYVFRLMQKLGASSRLELVAGIMRRRISELEAELLTFSARSHSPD